MATPNNPEKRKAIPLARGVLDYFPDALMAVAECSLAGNKQHHDGKPLHWDKSKSTDEADALLRHLIDRGTMDTDGIRHSAKIAWRALALLQREIDAENAVAEPQKQPVFQAELERLRDQRVAEIKAANDRLDAYLQDFGPNTASWHGIPFNPPSEDAE